MDKLPILSLQGKIVIFSYLLVPCLMASMIFELDWPSLVTIGNMMLCSQVYVVSLAPYFVNLEVVVPVRKYHTFTFLAASDPHLVNTICHWIPDCFLAQF